MTNQLEYTVSEIAAGIKRAVEDSFGFVRVKGEITGWKKAASGHVYFSLKDEKAVLSAICWKGTAGKIPFVVQDGLEVICVGRVTTYAERSNYQMIVEAMEPAGVGALMAMLEERKKKLAAEGLFDESRKRALPFMPQVIGVVTSPTGAVIRDILHRIAERYPVQVLVWPVLVQGEGAKEQIAAAISGFNKLKESRVESRESSGKTSSHDSSYSTLATHSFPRPDVIIVARGGGSLEDLWAFNEEIVVRAAANSKIPLISAVGHETDTTLIDFVSDRRAPTPTAAAEMAVPVRDELVLAVSEYDGRLIAALRRMWLQKRDVLNAMGRALPQLTSVMERATQRLDDWYERLVQSIPRLLAQRGEKIEFVARMLEQMNVQRVLERGFTLVRDADGKLVTRAAALNTGQEAQIVFADGEKKTIIR